MTNNCFISTVKRYYTLTSVSDVSGVNITAMVEQHYKFIFHVVPRWCEIGKCGVTRVLRFYT